MYNNISRKASLELWTYPEITPVVHYSWDI